MYHLMLDLKKMEAVESCYPFGQVHHVIFRNASSSIEEVQAQLKKIGHNELETLPIAATIEDAFMELMTQKKND